MRHRDPLLSFDVPRDWEDRSEVRYLAPPRQSGDAVSSPGRAVLTRDRLRDDEELGGWVERRLAAIAENADGFLVRLVSPERVDDRPAASALYATVEDGVPCEHRALSVQLSDRVVATLTLTAARTELAQLEPLFDRILASVRTGEN